MIRCMPPSPPWPSWTVGAHCWTWQRHGKPPRLPLPPSPPPARPVLLTPLIGGWWDQRWSRCASTNVHNRPVASARGHQMPSRCPHNPPDPSPGYACPGIPSSVHQSRRLLRHPRARYLHPTGTRKPLRPLPCSGQFPRPTHRLGVDYGQ